MRDENRIHERIQLSLDGRQVASLTAGALVVLGGVFILGMHTGRALAGREPHDRVDADRPADPLAALDAAPAADSSQKDPAAHLSYHDDLTRDAPPAPPRPQDSPAPPTGPRDSPAVAARSPRVGTDASASHPPRPALRSESGVTESSGSQTAAFSVQIGATQDPGEAARIADHFRTYRPRVVPADVPGRGRWYRIRVGAFESRESADRALRDLYRQTGVRAFVTAAR